MPAHNEEGYLEAAIKTVVTGLGTDRHDFEVVVVENGSADRTGAAAERLAAEYDTVRVLRLPQADYGAALRTGFLAAQGDIVVNFDVDMVDLDFLDRAVARMAEGPAAIVVGSKRAAGAEDERGVLRRLITATFAFVLRAGFGLTVSDTHGLKALRREPLVGLVEQCRFGQDIFDTELIIRAERAGLAVEEIPVRVTDQRPPRTPIARRIPRTIRGLAQLHGALRHPDR